MSYYNVGIFDNLHDREICDLADMATSPFEAPYIIMLYCIMSYYVLDMLSMY